MNIADLYPSKYLKATELTGDTVLTVSHVEMGIIGQDEDAESKPIIYFSEIQKGLVMNKTNGNTIANLLGPDTDLWGGQRITLFPTEVDFQGKQTLAIRVRMKRPMPTAAPQPRPGPDPLKAAKGAAWQKWQAMHPEGTPADKAEKLKAAARVFFSNRPSELLTAGEWIQLAANNFAKPPPPNPLSEEPVFKEDDIPF